MARRIRSVKPEWLDDERLNECSDAARVLSIGLLLMADDRGRGRLGKTAARDVFHGNTAADRLTEKFESALGELLGWYVRRYEVRGQQYYAVSNWHRHQYISKPSKPITPEPQEGRWLDPEAEAPILTQNGKNTDAGYDSGDPPEVSGSIPVALPVGLGSGREGKGREGNARRAPDAPPGKVYRTDAAGTHLVDPTAASFAPAGSVELYAFEAWSKAFGKMGATYDAHRAACLAERAGTGMTTQDADDAIAGAQLDPYVNGTKDGTKHNRLSFIFGSAERYEEFRDMGRNQRASESSEPTTGVRPRRPDPAEEHLAALKRAQRQKTIGTATPEELAAGERTAAAVTKLGRGLLR